MTSRRLIYALLGVFFILRFDFWQQPSTSLWLGLPMGLAYHVLYCLLAIGVLALLLRFAWPSELEDDEPVIRREGQP